jgi:peptide/nickel transport system substrate-binding protein
MFGKKYRRILGVCLAMSLMMTFIIGMAKAQDQSTIVIAFEQEPDTLIPNSTSTFSAVTQGLYERQVWDWDANYKIFPIMVTEIPTVDNGDVTTDAKGNTVVTYHLKPGMKWSDGQPITADDCVFGDKLFNSTSTAGTVFRSDYPSSVASVEKKDDLTVVQTFNSPFPDYTSSNDFLHCEFPEHVLQPLMDANGGKIDGLSWFTKGEGVVGYGPYKLDSWTPGDNMTFVANDNWDGPKPAIQKVIVKFITDANQMQNAFTNGEVDIAFNWANDLADGYSAVPGAVVYNLPEVYADALWMNMDPNGTQNPAMKDVNVRRAIIEAINRVDDTHQIDGKDLSVPLAYDAPNWWPDGLKGIDYDATKAAADLDAAGWKDTNGDGTRDKDGVELVLNFYTTTRKDRDDYQLAIQSDLKKVGIGTNLFQVDGPSQLFASFTDKGVMSTGQYDLSIYANSYDPISPISDPTVFTCSGIASATNPSGSNFSFFCDPNFDKLDTQVKSELDPAKRLDEKHQMVQLMTDATFWAGLYQRVWWVAIAGDRFSADSFKDTFGTLASNWLQKPELWTPKS